jgi:acyl-CoA thioesterase FadM
VEFSGARIEIDQQVMLNGNTHFRAQVTAALVDGRGRPRRMPENLAARFKAVLESQS